MHKVIPAVLLLIAAVPAIAPAQPIRAIGSEFQINSYTTGDQVEASVAADAEGDFVVAWGSGPPGDYPQYVLARRFDSAGVAQGEEWQVSAGTTEVDFEPDVAMDAEGEFVVVWTGAGVFPGDLLVIGRLYAADGSQVEVFLVGSGTSDRARAPAVAMGSDGSFVVAWDNDESDGSDVDGRSVQARRFDSTGEPEDDQFQVNSYTTDDQENADVGIDADGDFVVVWESVGAGDATARSIMAQRFASDGSAAGSELRVSISTAEDNSAPAVAVDGDGDFVVVWAAPGFLPGSQVLLGKRFASDGSLVDTFQANLGTSGGVDNPSISTGADGLMVAWSDSYSTQTDTDGRSIHGRYYSSSGAAVGSQFQINTFTTGDQQRPSIAGASDHFIVVWDSEGIDGDGLSVQGQLHGSSIFADGFESGDTSAWSS